MIQEIFNKEMPVELSYSSGGIIINKQITPVPSLTGNGIAGYIYLSTTIREKFNYEEMDVSNNSNNINLLWKAYGENDYTGNIMTDELEKVKEFWHEKNLYNFNAFLRTHPLLYTDGNLYGVEEVDRNEMSQQLGMFQLKQTAGLSPTTLQWHTKKKACRDFSVEEFTQLLLAIEHYTLPYYNEMQRRKEAIFNCTNKEDIFDISVEYSE